MHAEVRRREQPVHVRTDRVEGDVPQGEQAREADDDVEPQREHDVDHGEVQYPHPRLSCGGSHEGKRGERERNQRDAYPRLERNRTPAGVAHQPAVLWWSEIGTPLEKGGDARSVSDKLSGTVGHSFAEQTRRAEDEDKYQDEERKHVLVVAAEKAHLPVV